LQDILFRGKRVGNGDWIYGDLLHPHTEMGAEWLIVPIDKILKYATPVQPETIGQFTGLIDKNNQRIFEGDVVRPGRSGFGYGHLEVVRIEEGGFKPFSVAHWDLEPYSDESEVVGNIYDSPELAKRHSV